MPIRTLQLFVGNIKSSEEAVAIRFSDKRIELRTDNARVYSSLMTGRFPNFRKAIPKLPTAKVKLTLPEFASSIRKAAADGVESLHPPLRRLGEFRPHPVRRIDSIAQVDQGQDALHDFKKNGTQLALTCHFKMRLCRN